MQQTHAHGPRPVATIDDQLAGAPISWGACEIPGWGVMPSPDRVLAEMAELGLRGTELGAVGFFPDDPAAISALLHRHDLELVGGFVPLVLHEPGLEDTIGEARRAAELIAQAGGRMFVVGVVQDLEWSAPDELDDRGLARVAQHLNAIESLTAEYGLTVAVHPHAGTLIETAEQVERAMEVVEVGWCLDTGHLTIGGADPVQFARNHGDRVVHVHLKDVDANVAADFRAGQISLVDATRNGLFLPLGQGDARIADVLEALQTYGYDGWLVLEQDTATEAPPPGAADRSNKAPPSGAADRPITAPPPGAADALITGDEPTVAGGPMRDALQSIAFLHHTARTTEEINR